jgi:hypothetical protein
MVSYFLLSRLKCGALAFPGADVRTQLHYTHYRLLRCHWDNSSIRDTRD